MNKRLPTLLLLTVLLTCQSATAHTSGFFDLGYTHFDFSDGFIVSNNGSYEGVRLGGGVIYQQREQSWFFVSLAGHLSAISGEYEKSILFSNHTITTREKHALVDVDGSVGAHLGRYVDADLKLGAWLNVPVHQGNDEQPQVVPYLGLGLGVNLTPHLSINADIKTLLFANSASIGLRYKL